MKGYAKTVPGRAMPRARMGIRVRAQTQVAVPVKIVVQRKVAFGESLKLVGSVPELGAWNEAKGAAMRWGDGDVWTVDTQAPVGVEVCFKIVRVNGDSVLEWEQGGDRKFKALGADCGLNIDCSWGQTDNLKVEAVPLNGNGNGKAPASSDGNGNGNGNGAHAAAPAPPPPQQQQQQAPPPPQQQQQQAPSSNGGGNGAKWVGTAPEFVTDHAAHPSKGDRKGVWKADGLKGATLDIVKGDEKAGSWLQKLGVQKALLVDAAPEQRPGVDALANAYVYATWVNNGALLCKEDGGHQRPSRHAALAMDMYRSVEAVIGGAGSGSQAVLAARKMVTTLPSFSGEFRQAVPLTRIRDIAHRNDIPSQLKNEIKHTLQNKLHRSAGPEDLVATEKMLERINAGDYNADFKNEFNIFARELREFFNATGLVDLLNGTTESLDAAGKTAVQQFLASKGKVEGQGSPTPEDLLSLLNAGTLARTQYASLLRDALASDADADALSKRQRLRLSDIRLEEYNFLTLSRIINSLEAINAAQKLAGATKQDWSVPVAALKAGLRNMGLAQFNQGEMFVVETELQAWYDAAPFTETKEQALRAKATLERALRTAAEFSEVVMDVYAAPARGLGGALGVPDHMASVFAESEIRASVAFQVSKLATLMVKATRTAAKLESWDGLVTGESVGRLMEVDKLSPEVMSGVSDDVVLLVRSSDGDEELGPLGARLAGVILCQDLPHLSHLGVRARQEQVTFATCDDVDYVSNNVKPLVGKTVKLTVSSSGVTLKEASAADVAAAAASAGAAKAAAPAAGAGGAKLAVIKKAKTAAVVAAKDFTLDTCGAKSEKCAVLETLAGGAKGLFKVPTSVCLPFGVMDQAIAASTKAAEYTALLAELEGDKLSGQPLEAACAKMQALLASMEVPKDALAGLSKAFAADALLVVRSSANVEDMAGMSAAGLYDSVVGVPSSSSADVAAAVCTVWASLYTRRAVLSRRAGGVKQGDASMAVLVQELKAPEVSFVLHTVRPSDQNVDVLLAELAPGQGETLASGTRGSPWRFEVTKSSMSVATLAFANFSHALVLPSGKDSAAPAAGSMTGRLVERAVDYSQQPLSTDADFRSKLAKSLASVGVHIEGHFKGEAQDIEGGLVRPAGGGEAELYIFQTRPQS